MHEDFKENYIKQQKLQAEQRKARLEKIGMGNSSSRPAASKPVQNKPAVSTAHAQSVKGSADSAAAAEYLRKRREAARQQSAPPAVKPSPRPVTNTAEKAGTQRPAAAPAPSQIRNESRTGGVAVTQQYTLSEIRAAAQKQNEIKAQPRSQAQPQKAVSQAQSPERRPAPAATSQQSAVKNSAPAAAKKKVSTTPSYGTVPAYANRRSNNHPTDDQIFKKTLSDSESRALMFSLTGRAEQPDDGGDVDIINLGMIRAPKREKQEEKKKSNLAGKIIGRFFSVVAMLLVFCVVAVFATVGIIAHGPSETLRDLLVNSAMQASATKWVPGLFLSDKEVDAIINKSEETVEDKVSIEDIISDADADVDEWENSKDGMIFETVSGSTFKAYVLLVKDPSRVFVGTSTDNYDTAKAGIDVFQAAARYDSVACINGGEFLDNGGSGTGHKPMGLTFSQGKCVNDDGLKKTFLGFTAENELIVRESMTREEAEELGIRDAVSFQNGNTLIQRDGDEVIVYYQDGNTGTAQRTGIGQRADGTVILIVTDGRSASSLGATHNDMIDLMISYGAVSAGLVDGGSSSLMYYEDYYTKYDYDTSKLDEYQKKGLVNNYKAFTEPRRIPTFFMVEPLKED